MPLQNNWKAHFRSLTMVNESGHRKQLATKDGGKMMQMPLVSKSLWMAQGQNQPLARVNYNAQQQWVLLNKSFTMHTKI